jgi:hypothetical protein
MMVSLGLEGSAHMRVMEEPVATHHGCCEFANCAMSIIRKISNR